MPLLRSSRKILLGEKITPADVFDDYSERVIAQGRIVLCALSLLAIWLDPAQLADSATATKVLLAYSALALALLAIPFWKFPGPVAGYVVRHRDRAPGSSVSRPGVVSVVLRPHVAGNKMGIKGVFYFLAPVQGSRGFFIPLNFLAKIG